MSSTTADLVLVTQDPRFEGGVRSQLNAFIDAAVALGRSPEALYVTHPRLHGDPGAAIGIAGAPPPLARIDVLNQIVGARRAVARVRGARSLWVVSTVASAGAAAAFSDLPYDCWIGTGLADEWRSRRRGLSPVQQLALKVNARPLLALERRVLRDARAVYATSLTSRESVAAAGGLPPDEIGILPISVDIARFSPLPEEEWLAGLERPTIAFIGRADDPRKNVRLLLDALPEIRRRIPEARVMLIGRPPRDPLPEGAEASGPVASVADVLRRASLFVLPSLQEGFGIVVAEALASGVPVVATPCGGPEHLLEESGGGIVTPDWSVRALADAAVGLLDDRDRLLRARRRGRDYVVREHSPAALAAALAVALVGTRYR